MKRKVKIQHFVQFWAISEDGKPVPYSRKKAFEFFDKLAAGESVNHKTAKAKP